MMQVVGIGAGGHAKVMIDILQLQGEHEIVGLTDPDPALFNTRVLNVPVLGNDSILRSLLDRGVSAAFIGVGSVGDSQVRRRLFEHALALGFTIVPVIHPTAVIAASASIGSGPIILANAVINPDARLGDNVIVNTGAIVEHDCVLSNHVHVATGAKLASGVHVGDGVHVGIGASVKQRITIGAGAIVGAGAVVIRDVPGGVTVAGVPAKPIRAPGKERRGE